MDRNGFMHFLISLSAICMNADAYSTDLHTYQVRRNFQVASVRVETLEEVPCRSILEGISICLDTRNCKVINYFTNGHYQLVTNLLASAVVEAVPSKSILCKCFVSDQNIKVSSLN